MWTSYKGYLKNNHSSQNVKNTITAKRNEEYFCDRVVQSVDLSLIKERLENWRSAKKKEQKFQSSSVHSWCRHTLNYLFERTKYTVF